MLGGGARPLPLPPAAEDAKGPSESERFKFKGVCSDRVLTPGEFLEKNLLS